MQYTYFPRLNQFLLEDEVLGLEFRPSRVVASLSSCQRNIAASSGILGSLCQGTDIMIAVVLE